MDEEAFLQSVVSTDKPFGALQIADFSKPVYSPTNHYIDLTREPYYRALLMLRHNLKLASDFYFSQIRNACNVDLFMMTPSISSPMGPGSDSETIPIKFGNLHTYLVDSSQFGFEPLLMNGFKEVYCYLPSMRGEDPDNRHLNQFFHCESEIVGVLGDLIPNIEEYVRLLCRTVYSMPNIVERLSMNCDASMATASRIASGQQMATLEFDRAIELLEENASSSLYTTSPGGRNITSAGELRVLEILNVSGPTWITRYDRDQVPFYQKPDPEDSSKVLNADLLFPPLIQGGFGGEIVGAGQRQDNINEMYDSLLRQRISSEPYEWYINLRTLPQYQSTSGFGLGVERFIAWILGLDNIRDAIIYPRLKNIVTLP